MVLEHRGLLEPAADAGVRNLGLGQHREIDRLAEECGAGIGARLAGDHVHHRRLACTVGADDAAQFAVLDGERKVVQCLEPVEAHRDPVEIEDRAVRRVDTRTGDAHPRLGEAGRAAVDAVDGNVRHWCAPTLAARRRRASPMTPRGRKERDQNEQEAQEEEPVLGECLREPALRPIHHECADDGSDERSAAAHAPPRSRSRSNSPATFRSG